MPVTDDDIKQAVREAVQEDMPLAIGEALGPLIHTAVRTDMRWWRRAAIVGYLTLALALGYGIHDNRERSTKARGVLCTMLVGSDITTYAYAREGTINQQQLQRSLRQSAAYRRLLQPAPACSPTVTPPPQVAPVPPLRPQR